MAERVGGIFYDVTLDTSKMIDGQRAVEREVGKAAATFNAITVAVKLYALALSALKVAELADEFRLLGTRVEVAAGSIESGAAAMSQLVEISKRTQTSLAANIDIFARLNSSILQMGGTQADTLRTTELLAKAIKVSGATATETKAAMLQFGQALGSGKLQGDEFRSLMENAPYLMKQLADSIGVPIGALKQLSTDGKLTSDVIVNALSAAAGKIDADFKKFPQTIEAAMVVANDQAALAALKFDELTGKSAALTGIIKGTGEVVEKLGDQFGAANEEAGKFGRNDAVSTWAERTRDLLSYVLDAADGVYRVVQLLGIGVGALAAKGAALLTFNLSSARAQIAAINEAADADVDRVIQRKLAGQQIRDLAAAGAGGGRGFVNPEPVASKLKTPDGSSTAGSKFDSESYLAGLQAKTLDGLAKIDSMEQEALRKNAELLKAGKITRAEAAKAATLIEQNAAQDRLDIQLKNAEDIRAAIEAGGKQEAEARQKAAEEQKKGQTFASGLLLQGNELAQVQAELEAKTALLLQYAAQDQANAELYAAARVALEQQTSAKIAEIVQKQHDQQASQNAMMLQNYGAIFGNLADITKTFAGKQNDAYKVLFAASKAFAIAESIIKIQQGIAQAASLPFPANLGAMASVVAATSSIVATIAGTNYGGGRQYGGPTSAGSMYRVNETGQPEMWRGANGAQYMMAATDGKVIPADQVGAGGAAWTIIVNQAPPGTTASVNDQERVVTIAIGEVANQIRENSGQVWTALRGATNVQSRIS